MKKPSVKELRKILIEKYPDQTLFINAATKKELQPMLELDQKETKLDTTDPETLLNSVEVVNKTAEPQKEEPATPNPNDPEWTDFVLSLFDKNEKDASGNPKADGLRRIAGKLLGWFNILTDVVQAPGLDGRATVVVKLEFPESFGRPYRMVSGAADVSSVNTAKEFAIHPVATAETRAEGRALRKALWLTKVLTAEEMQGSELDEPKGTDGRIVTSMINSLHTMCASQSIDLNKFVNLKFGEIKLEDLTHKQGLELANDLSKYKRKEMEIPDVVRA